MRSALLLLLTLSALGLAVPAAAQVLTGNQSFGAGNVSSSYASGVYTLTASGTGPKGTSDNGGFLYVPVTGDSSITMRVTGGTDVRGLVAVMLRNDLTASSAFVLVGWDDYNYADSIQYSTRATASASIGYPSAYSSAANPTYFKLVRSGSTYTMSYSLNGTTYTTISTQTLTLASNIYAGIWMDSENYSGGGNTVTVDSVTVTGLPTVLTPTSATVACPNDTVGQTATCATETLTATNGSVTLGATPFTSSDSEFIVPLGSCTANLVLTAGSSCATGALALTATSAGAKSSTITVNSSVTASFAASGTAINAGVLTPSQTSVTCPNMGLGQSANCTTVLYTAVGGPVTFSSSSVYTLAGTGAAYFASPSNYNNCAVGMTIAAGANCLMYIYENGSSNTAGTYSAVLTPNLSSGTAQPITYSTTESAAYLSPTINNGGTINCPSVAIGATSTCTTGVTLTATGGSVTLAATPFVPSWGNLSYYAPATSSFYEANVTVANGTCTPGLTLTAGQSCTTGTITASPVAAGTNTTGISVITSSGGGAYWYANVTGTGTDGGIGAVGPRTLACPTAVVGTSVTCGTLDIFANAAVSFNSAPYTSIDSEFTIATTNDYCRSTSLATNGDCQTGLVTFTPTSAGNKSTTLTVTPTSGTTGTTAITGIALPAPGSLTVSGTIACGTVQYGTTGTCATETLTASGGAVTLGATPFGPSNTDFTVPLGTCTAGAVLASGGTCTTGAITFTPSTSTAETDTVTVSTASGTGTTFQTSGTGVTYGTASLSTYNGTNCGSAVAGYGEVGCYYVLVTASGGPVTLGSVPFSVSNTAILRNASSSAGTTCTAGLVLASGGTCYIGNYTYVLQMYPAAIGPNAVSITVTPAHGTAGAVTLNVTGTPGSAAASPTSIACPGASTIASSSCPAVTLTATGLVSFTASPYSIPNSYYSLGAGDTCSGASLTNGQTCTVPSLTFAPTTNNGSNATTLTVARSDGGTNQTISVTGTAAIGTATLAAVSSTTCPTLTLGSSESCGAIKITATGGPLQLNSPLTTVSNASVGYSVDNTGTCTAGQVLAANASCTTGAIQFAPTSAGTYTTNINVAHDSTSTAITFTGNTWGTAVITTPAGNTGTAVAGTGANYYFGPDEYAVVTASGGPIKFGATPYTSTGSTTQLSVSTTDTTCTANQVLAQNATCYIGHTSYFQWAPTQVGTWVTTTTTNLTGGTPGSFTLTGTATVGGFNSTPGSVSCGTANNLAPASCGTLVIKAVGFISFTSTAFTSSDPQFTIAPGGCANAVLSNGQTCTTGVITFTPTSNSNGSTISAVLAASRTDGATPTGVAISGVIGGAGTAVLTANTSLTCPITTVGTPVSCGSLTVKANGGPMQLGSTVATLANSQFTFDSSGTCTASQTLASAATCTTGNVIFTPISAASASSTATVSPAIGVAGSATFSATTYGNLSASVTTVACPATAVAVTGTCATVTLTATGGPVTLAATPISVGDSHFTAPLGTCTANLALATSGTCTTGAITFTPTSSSPLATTATVAVATGTGTSFAITGTGTYGTVSLNHTALACGAMTLGSTAINCGTITVSATGGPVALSSSLLSFSNASGFTVSNGTCTPNTVLASGATCTTGNVVFSPSSAGVYSPTLTVSCSGTSCSPSVAITGTAYTYAYTTTAWTPAAGSSCTTALAQTRTVTCQQYNGTSYTAVANSSCTGTAPVSSQSVADSGGCGTVSVTNSTCTTANIGSSVTCTPSVVTATGGPLTFTTGVFHNLSNSEVSVADGTCANTTLAAGSTCTSGAIVFTPTAAGTRNATISVTPTSGLGTGANFVTTGAIGAGTITVGTVPTCANTADGVPVSCGTVTLTAAGGTVVFGAAPLVSSNADFSIGAGTCANATLSAGQNCSSTALSFDPSLAGSESATISVTPTSGSATSFTASGVGHVYAWVSSSWTPATGSACTASLAQTRTVSCQREDGTTVTDANCTGTKPASSQTVSDYSGCTFSWSQSGFSSCTGGNGTWAYSAWTPTAGCGTNLPQTRTGTCTVNANSGTETQSVSCLRSDGTTVTDVSCSSVGAKPAASTSCTPSTFSCDTEGSLTQTFNDTSTCSYTWSETTWGAPSSSCAASATETRNVTCLQSDGSTVSDSLCAAAGAKPASSQTLSVYSGCSYTWNPSAWSASSNTCSATATQTRTVSCLQSDGQTVDASLCAGAGTEPAISQTVSDFSTCTFTWTQGGFGACSGGTATWNYTAWTPSTGCGSNIAQSRTGTCVPDSSTGSQSQSVTCVRGDGVTVDGSNCTGSAPAATQSCTATTGYSCGTEGALSQDFSDTSTCTYSWNASAWSASSNTCSTSAVQTRVVSCMQSDGSVVNASLCANAGTAPTSTQTVTDLSSCTYNWTASGYGACTGGAGTWNYSSWSPTAGCGSNLPQTRTGTCVANVSGGTQTQTAACVRSDGATVANEQCAGNAEPALSQSCTATAGYSCGTEAVLSGTFNDTSTCSYSWTSGAWSAASSSCSASATETRSVACTQSDGTTVADAECASVGAKPATSQTVADFAGCTYSWSASAWGNDTSTCSASDTQTRNVTCLQPDGETVDSSNCAATGNAPASSQTVANYSSCTFSWTAGGFSACSTGTGTWNYTAWTPAAGCGTTSQSRTAACAIDANSGTQTQSVVCTRADGTTVANSNCTGTAPLSSQACTPDSDLACGQVAALSQTVALSNGCNYSWSEGAFGACTGGTGVWSYTAWTPAVGSACTQSLNQTRSGSCAATTNSGSFTRTVSCVDQNGTTVASSNCSGTAPVLTLPCTPTSGFSCGTEGLLAQSVVDTSTCATYNWHASGFGSCTGGTAAWSYSAWTPTCGVGPTTQSRTGTCTGTVNSGHATQTVTCQDNHGNTVANSNCTGAAPATSETCTPTTGLSCGTEGLLTQKVTLTNKCTTQNNCVVTPTNSCVTTP